MVSVKWDSTQALWILKSDVDLAVSRAALFDFFADAFQLEQITPPWLNFRVLTSAPIDIQPGTLIDYQLKLRGIPIGWRTEISEWEPPVAFVDRQLKGPYRLWEHLHTFHEITNGTRVSDEVRYRVPGGSFVHWLFVKRELLRIFHYRAERMIEIFKHPKAMSDSTASSIEA